MRRIFLALLICLLPLQSFAGLAMSTQMAGMEANMSMAMSTADAAQAPCHEASQPDAAAGQECCGTQSVCQALCHIVIAPMTLWIVSSAVPAADSPTTFSTAFQSADLCAGFKPPLI